jgi:OOP family OmpA-OmpF porin
MKLSIDRANSVRSYLLSLGIKASTIKAEGFGSSAPIYTNANLRSMNRRVEIFILNQ